MNVVHSRMRKNNNVQNPCACDTADQHFDTKVKCRTEWASFWVKFPTVMYGAKLQLNACGEGGGERTVFELTGTSDHTFNAVLL